MSGDGSAVAFRLNELQAKILKCDEEIKDLAIEMECAQAGLAMQISEKEAANKALIDKINANHADELSADIVLTEHYKDGAAEACISALMKQQDSVILKDKESLKHVLLEYADSHLQSRENSLLAAHADEKQAKMSEEEEKYMHAVQMALISHKERMSQLN